MKADAFDWALSLLQVELGWLGFRWIKGLAPFLFVCLGRQKNIKGFSMFAAGVSSVAARFRV